MSRFWEVSACVINSDKELKLLVESPYDKSKTKEIIMNVHPEYEKISLKKTAKPDWCAGWED